MPKRRKPKVPAYRLHRRSGQAVVTLSDPQSGRRRDVYLGEYGSDASRKLYADTLKAFENAGRVIDAMPDAEAKAGRGSVADLCLRFWREYAKVQYAEGEGVSKEAEKYRAVIRVMRSHCGAMPASAFGPKMLKEVRQKLIDKKLALNTINERTRCVVRIFKWGVEEEIIDGEQLHALKAIPGVKRGAPGIKAGGRIKPVPDADIDAIAPHVSRQVWALVQVLRFTGARVSEVAALRPMDLDMSGKAWLYRPEKHKTTRHGRDRLIAFGREAQAAIRPFLADRPIDRPLFSPREAEAERRAKDAAGKRRENQPETPTKTDRKLRDAYDSSSLRQAVEAACERAGVTAWTPARLRKNAATRIAAVLGAEHASKALGHSSQTVTHAHYIDNAERLAIEAAEKAG